MRGPCDTPSIRRRLLVLLLLPTAAIAATATYSAYRTSLAPLEAAYDAELRDTALAVASNIEARGNASPRLALTPDALTLLRSDAVDTIYYRVSGADGRFIAGDADLAVPHQGIGRLEFTDATLRGHPIRVASYRAANAGGAIVTVAETTHKRQAARRSVLRSSLAVDAAQLATALLAIWLGVSLAIAPLRNVERQLAARHPQDLAPLATAGVPQEIHSLIAALNRLFQALQEAELAERSFIENAAHQLRTPLAGMLAHLELMAADGANVNLAQARAALEGGRRLARTTQQLLALARSDAASRASAEIEDVSLPDVIKACVESRLAAADAAGVDLGAELDSAMAAHGRAWMLDEALGNLADNAIAATPAGGSVTLRCGMSAGRPWLEVCDTGVGIPAAERAQVFERFYRASNARTAGSGLGLAIVREVAQLHRAVLSVEAGSDGRGTRVRMTFPVAGLQPAGAGIPSAFATNPN